MGRDLGLGENTIAYFVARDAWSEGDDLTGYIVGEDEGWLGSPEGVVAEFLVVGVYWLC